MRRANRCQAHIQDSLVIQWKVGYCADSDEIVREGTAGDGPYDWRREQLHPVGSLKLHGVEESSERAGASRITCTRGRRPDALVII